MGAGIAGEASRRDPNLPWIYGQLIKSFGHHVYLINSDSQKYGPKNLLMFPTKNEVWEDSSAKRVIQSCQETIKLADIYGWKTIALPRPGCGLGGLDWHTDLEPTLWQLLDDRFLIVSFPGEK